MPNNPLLKNMEFTQFARTADANGNRTKPVTTALNPDYGTELLTDNQGRLIVRVAGSNGFGGNSFGTAGGLTSGFQISSVANTKLAQLTGFNNNATQRWLQIFNTVGAPAPFAVPSFSIIVPGNSNFSYQPALPRNFTTGIYVASSITPNIFTTAGGTDFWLNFELA